MNGIDDLKRNASEWQVFSEVQQCGYSTVRQNEILGSRAEHQEDVWTLLEVSTTYIKGYSELLATVVLETLNVSWIETIEQDNCC